MTLGNGRQAVIEAGYNTKAPHAYSTDLLNKQYIKDEIDYRLKELENATKTTMAAIEKDHNAAFVQETEGSLSELKDNKSVMFIAATNPNNKTYKIRITDSTINTNKNYVCHAVSRGTAADVTQQIR